MRRATVYTKERGLSSFRTIVAVMSDLDENDEYIYDGE